MALTLLHNHTDGEIRGGTQGATYVKEKVMRSRLPMLEEDTYEEEYSADDEGGMDFESSFDTSFDVEPEVFQSSRRSHSQFDDDAQFASIPQRHFTRPMSECQLPSPGHTRVSSYQTEFEDDDSDEDIQVEHECHPNCVLCRISTYVYKVRHPELYGDDWSDDEDDFEDCLTSAPPTHCVPECISCARERLRAEGYIFPVYQCDQSDYTSDSDEAKVPEKEKHTEQALETKKTDVREPRGLFNIVFTPPSPRSQKRAESTTPVELDGFFPRVFFPPTKTSDPDV